MKFDFPKLSTFDFNGQRWYETPSGKSYPSVTTVLGATEDEEKTASLNAWRNGVGHINADLITKNAADNGTVLHKIIERFLMGEKDLYAPIKDYVIEEHNKEAFNGIRGKLKLIDEVWGLEIGLYSHFLEMAGRTDCVGIYKGIPSIIDFKTSRRLKNQNQIEDYKYQLAAYAIMFNEMFETNIETGFILMSAQGGFPMEFKINLVEYFEPLYERVQKFYDQLNTKLKIAVG